MQKLSKSLVFTENLGSQSCCTLKRLIYEKCSFSSSGIAAAIYIATVLTATKHTGF